MLKPKPVTNLSKAFAKTTGFSASLAILLTSLSALGQEAIRIPKDMMQDPQVLSMVAEYQTIASNPKLAKTCGNKKYFGLQTVRIDGVRTVRFFVEGPGIGCLPSRLRPKSPWVVTRFGRGWEEQDHTNWRKFVYELGMGVETKKCNTVDSCMLSSANILKNEVDMKAFHYADCADFPYYLRTYFSYRMGLPFSLASYIRSRALTEEDQQKRVEINEKIALYFERVMAANNGSIEPYIIPMPPPGNKAAKTLAPDISTIPGLQIAEVVELRDLLKKQERSMDPRYARAGNWVAGRTWVTDQTKVDFYNGWVQKLRNSASTATLRIWRNEGETYYDEGSRKEINEEQPDFYSPVLDSRGIVPGTVIYKTDGHTAVVYRIDQENGNIHYIDAHPDNSITFGVVDQTWIKGMLGDSFLGGGFKNFRPIAYRKSWWSSKVTAQMAEDKDMGYYYSTEQFDKFPDVNARASYNEGGIKAQVGYLDFLRLRMSEGRYRIDPSVQFKADVQSLCKNMQIRRDSVWEATERGMHLQPHPTQLPSNIFGAQGDWEKFSTPGRDVVFKQRVISLTESLAKYKQLIRAKSPLLSANYTVETLKTELLNAWTTAAQACSVSYVNSNNQEVKFNLVEAIRRAPYMDYDPYICPERRYGATSAGELASCADDAQKTDWSRHQQFLRNRTEKTPLEPMGWSLNELKAMPGSDAVDANLIKKLDVLGAIQAF